MRVPFRERDPVPIALAAFAVIIILSLLAANLGKVSFLGGGRDYSAAFAEAAGLRNGEEVRIAGVKVGKVTGLDLEPDAERGAHVKVTFQIDDGVRLGELTRAHIKIKTVLGAHYLALEPRGSGRLARQIPVARTSTPYEVTAALQDVSGRLGQIDHQEMAKSFDVLADTFRNSPDEIQASLRGLRRLSETVASRDDELHELSVKARSVSKLLADRNQDFARLIEDGDRILQAVRARRQVIHDLLVRTVTLSQQINALIAENEAELKPMLANLQRVNKILLRNQDNLDRMVQLYAPFARQFTDATGSGRWFDAYIQNLLPIPASIQPAPGGGSGGGGTHQGGRSGGTLPFLP
jgi:phospholipid/cholesterol/gamma-HCH transport system substrate-binding protein